MFWMKLEVANISFLRQVDESMMTKLLMFNFQIYTKFISKVPDIFSFPIIFIFSIIFIIVNIKWIGLSLIVVFLVTSFLLYCMSLQIVKKEVYTEYYTSQRSLIVLEIFQKLKHIRTDCFEDYFKREIKKVRDKELHCLEMQETFRLVSDLII